MLTFSVGLCKAASPGSEVLCSGWEHTQLWAKPVPSCPIIDLDFDLAGPPWREWRVIKSPGWLKSESVSLAEIINHLQLSVVALWCGHLLGTETRVANTVIWCGGLSRSRIKGVWTGILGSLCQIQGQEIASHRQGKERKKAVDESQEGRERRTDSRRRKGFSDQSWPTHRKQKLRKRSKILRTLTLFIELRMPTACFSLLYVFVRGNIYFPNEVLEYYTDGTGGKISVSGCYFLLLLFLATALLSQRFSVALRINTHLICFFFFKWPWLRHSNPNLTFSFNFTLKPLHTFFYKYEKKTFILIGKEKGIQVLGQSENDPEGQHSREEHWLV